jgi:hypothetical protein
VLAQDVGGEGLGLGEDGDQEVGAGDLVAAGALDVEDGALEDAADADGLVDGAGSCGASGGCAGVVLADLVLAEPVGFFGGRRGGRSVFCSMKASSSARSFSTSP